MNHKSLGGIGGALALVLTCALAIGARAGIATKAAEGTDLTGATAGVWSGGSGANGSPGSGDVATWTSTSLGAGLTLGSSSAWSGISVSGAESNIIISGAGTLTLGASGISLSATNLTFATPIVLGANQTWTANWPDTLRVSGIIGGSSYGITIAGVGMTIFSGPNIYDGATLVQGGGTLMLTGMGSLGSGGSSTLALAGSTGYGTLQYDSSATSSFTSITIGATGGENGTLNQTAGTINVSGNVKLAPSADGQGTINLSGGRLAVTGTLSVGVRGSRSGIVNASGTGNLTAGALVVGAFSSGQPSTGVFMQTNATTIAVGSLTLAQSSTDGNTHTGTYYLAGGNLNTGFIGGGAATGGGSDNSYFYFNGGTLSPLASSTTFMQGLTAAYVANGGAIINTAGSDITIGQPLLHATGATTDSLTKTGAGTLTLTGANTYGGFTSISGGALILNSPFLSNSSLVSVVSGSTLTLSFTGTNTVAFLVLDGVNQPAGIHDAATDPAYITGTGSLLVVPNYAQFGQPQSATNGVGGTASFTYTAPGWLAAQYQWYKVPGIPMPGATNSTFTLWSVETADAGTYYAVADGTFGMFQSSNATLTVLPATTPQYPAAVNPNVALVDSFDGWGVSLCWWANVCGGYSNRHEYASLAFATLGFNIVRYNIGGGENPGLSNTMEYRAQMPGFEPTNGVWNWNADANQRWMLKQAVALGANRVVAFANSPPWWMTVSGSATGAPGGTNNLKTSFETNFANYLATVVSNLTVLDGIHFDYVTPMNEPSGAWTLGGPQEGCHMSTAQQARMVNALRPALNAQAVTAGIDAPECAAESDSINTLNAYGSAKTNVALVCSHTYGSITNLSAALNMPAWNSEYSDADGTGLTMSRRIHDDLNGSGVSAWCYWQFIDNFGGWGMIYNPENGSGNTAYSFNQKFYVMWQFSHFIRPGFQIINVGDTNSLAAYDATNHSLIIVVLNDSTNACNANYSLGAFSSTGNQAVRWRTSANENGNPLAAVTISNQQLVAYLAPQSVTTLVISDVFATRPIAWYPLEGNAQDASGNGNNATWVTNATFVSGKIGAQAAQFSGNTNSYIVIPRSISNSFTITCWVKTTATSAVGNGQWWNGMGIVDGEVAGVANDFGLTFLGNAAAFGIGNPDITVTSTNAINNGQWHHLAAVWDNVTGQVQLFVDGGLQASAVGPTASRTAPSSLRLGSIQAAYAGGYLAGTIDDVRLFGRVLNATEVIGAMNHGPTLATIAASSILAGRTLLLTNTASDSDLPAQTLTWSLSSAPAGAAITVINPTNGVLSWRPAIAQSPSTNTFNVVVADNGTPQLTATQSVSVTVSRPVPPQLLSPAWSGNAFSLRVAGDAGPDYVIETASNLSATIMWTPVVTNFSATPPIQWIDTSVSNHPQRFYRVHLAP